MLPIPMAVVYSGLVGVLIALIVATATNKWQLRVFVLLALRLAIGWHFLFEGLHKIHSHAVGPTETNRVFTSEPYFAAGEGPLADYLRTKFIGAPETIYTPILAQPTPMTPDAFANLTTEKQADLCQKSIADDLQKAAQETIEGLVKDAAAKKAEKETKKKAADETPEGTTKEEKEKKEDATAKFKTAEAASNAADFKVKLASDDGREMKAAYARWVYGTDRRDCKIVLVSSDVPLSAPERLHILELYKKEAEEFAVKQKQHLGHGTGMDMTRAKKVEADYRTAKTELAKDCEAFVTELKKSVGYDKVEPKPKPLERIDTITMWSITCIGAGLLLGLFTRFCCLAGFGFLVMTYLAHPTVPWLPLPPMTEGNPLFINKNLIEALALLVIAAHPTGRWLGLDALIHRIIFGTKESS